MRNLVLALACAACSLIGAAPAIAGNVSLATALQRSELVVTIQLDTPHTTKVSVPVSPFGEKDCGTYDSYVVTGKVVEVLHPTKMKYSVVDPDERIVVFPGNIDQLVDLTRIACRDGTSKSPIYERFAGADLANLADGVTRTALLRWENGFGWTEAVAGSWLEKPPSKAKLAAVRRMRFVEDPEENDALCVTNADCVEDDLSCEPCGPCGPLPPNARALVGRYIALCHEAKKPLPGRCGSCGDRKDPFGPETHLVCRAMRCTLDVVKPKPVPNPAPNPTPKPVPDAQKTLDAPAPPAIPRP